MSKIDHSLFSAHEHALADAYGDCPECGSHLAIKHGKSGPFLGCSGYPECHYTRAVYDNHIEVLTEVAGSACPICSSVMAIKKGRYGMFLGCMNFPACHYLQPLQEKNDTKVVCPSCHHGHLIERTNKYGKQFFACDDYPKCRYVVNFPPVAQTCEKCGWEVLIKKRDGLYCPQINCDYKTDI